MDFDKQQHRNAWSGVLMWERVSPVVLTVIGCALSVYFLQLLFGTLLSQQLAISREAITDARLWTLLTHLFAAEPQFLFVLFFHLICLATLGSILESEVGPKGFATVFLSAGLFGGLAHLGFRAQPFLGMQAAVSGVVAATLLLHPKAFLDFKIIPPMPCWVFAVIYAAVSLCYMLMDSNGHLLGLEMHIVGAIVGAWLATNAMEPLDHYFAEPDPYFRQNQKPESEAPGMEVSYVAAKSGSSQPSTKAPEHDEGPSEAEINRVLDKLSQVGLANLAEHEREVLERAADRKRP